MKRYTTHTIGIAAIVLFAAMGAQAATIANYGDWEGNDVWYNQVSENTEYGAYGAPIVTGNAVSFDPLGIDATSNGGTMQNKAILDFDILAKGDQYISGITFSELGNFSMNGFGAAELDITANFTVTVLEANGSSVSLAQDYSMSFTPNSSGTFTHAGGLFPTTGAWTGDIYIDVGDIAANATLVNLSLENILYVESDAGTDALINKSIEESLTITSTIIPEPASAVLLVGAASCIGFVRRRFIG